VAPADFDEQHGKQLKKPPFFFPVYFSDKVFVSSIDFALGDDCSVFEP